MAINLASKFSKYVDDAFEHECLLAAPQVTAWTSPASTR